MKKISLTRGFETLVDDDDYEFLNQFEWYCSDNGSGYNYVHRAHPLTNSSIKMHRMLTAAMSGEEVDHKDGNGLNNQRSNLRLCTRSRNVVNCDARKNKRYSDYKGVSAV